MEDGASVEMPAVGNEGLIGRQPTDEFHRNAGLQHMLLGHTQP
jgi:hypothetical protein